MKYDLEVRTEKFAKDVREFVKMLPKSLTNSSDILQLSRASASVAANYIEANEGLSTKDFYYRIKVCRKESKESGLFLRLIDCKENRQLDNERERLNKEATELKLIFNKIVKSESNQKIEH